MSWSLDASYAECRRITRRSATNFYYAFFLLPRAKRRGMHALYAFLRHTDDLGDSPQPADVRREALGRWRTSLERALCGEFESPLFPALADTVARFDIPPDYLREAIGGVMRDLDAAAFESWEDLAGYCYQVAGVVGLACLHIWGFDGSLQAEEAARACGEAFQLTNILRDLGEDAAAGRVYLPQEDLRRFQYAADELPRGVHDGRFQALMRFELARAGQLYRAAERLEAHLSPDGRRVFGAMRAIYRALLEEIERADGDVFSRRVRLSTWRKLALAARWLPRPPWPRLRRAGTAAGGELPSGAAPGARTP